MGRIRPARWRNNGSAMRSDSYLVWQESGCWNQGIKVPGWAPTGSDWSFFRQSEEERRGTPPVGPSRSPEVEATPERIKEHISLSRSPPPGGSTGASDCLQSGRWRQRSIERIPQVRCESETMKKGECWMAVIAEEPPVLALRSAQRAPGFWVCFYRKSELPLSTPLSLSLQTYIYI